MEKKDVPRGESQSIYSDDIVLTAWKDNKAVYVASNVHGGNMTGTCKRYNRNTKSQSSSKNTIILWVASIC